MRFSYLLLMTLVFVSRIGFAAPVMWDQSLWNPAQKKRLSVSEKMEMLSQASVVVLGEEHYNEAVQRAEAEIIKTLGTLPQDQGALTVGWEFLNAIDRVRIDEAYAAFQQATLSTEDFLQTLFPGSTAPLEYAPVMEAVRAQQGYLLPTNLTRAQKTPVTRGGIEALDPRLKPSDFALGGAAYFERFQEAMGPHPLPYPIENYFASQSLTDEVMATELLQAPTKGQRLLITGSFHGDYRDGVVHSLQRRIADGYVLYIKIIDASSYTEDELLELFVHPQYGPIADILFVVNEPRTP